MSTLVSVIIPFYKGKQWLETAIESVLSQTYKNIEVIVINDGSPEDISGIYAKYAEKLIFIDQENKGVAVARNEGMKTAKGEYIAFLDADDIWLPEKLEKQIKYMQLNKLKWSHCAYFRFIDGDSKLVYFPCNIFGFIYPLIYVWSPIATPCVVIRRDLLQEHPDFIFPAGVKAGEDSFLWRKIGKYYDLGYIPEALAKVRIRKSLHFAQNAAYNSIIQINGRTKFLEYKDEAKKITPRAPFVMLLAATYWCLLSKNILSLAPTSWQTTREVLGRLLYLPSYCIFRILRRSLIKSQKFR